MSKGYGRTQQAISALMADQPDGAWTTTELCHQVYGSAEKKHRVAVARAIRNMHLPSELGKICWRIKRTRYEYCLFNECSVESALRCTHLAFDCPTFSFDQWKYKWENDWKDQSDFDPVEQIRKEVQERIAEQIRYRDASPIERLDIDIEQAREFIDQASAWGLYPESVQIRKRDIAEWQRQKAELQVAA